MEELADLEELYENGFMEKAEYEQRRKAMLKRLKIPSSSGGGGASGFGRCRECGEPHEEARPAFCCNCGAKTEFAPRESQMDLALSGFHEDVDLGDELEAFDDDFDDPTAAVEEEMLEELLGELKYDSVVNKEYDSAVSGKALSRDTFAVSGDSRFSSRPAGRGRGKGRQMKPKQQKKPQQQQQQLPRDTFAVSGDERFSTRKPSEKKDKKKKKKEKEKKVDEDDAWAKLQQQAQAKKTKKKQQQQLPRDTFAVSGDARFSERKTAGSKKKPQQQALPRDTFADSGDARFSTRKPTRSKKQQPQSQQPQQSLPRDTFAVSGDARFSERKPTRSKKQQQALPRDTFAVSGDARFSERAAGGARGAPRSAAAEHKVVRGRVKEIVVEKPPAPVSPSGKFTPQGRPIRSFPREVVESDVPLPDGLKWHATPKDAKLGRDTFASPGDDRFSERAPKLPSGKVQDSPGECKFCNEAIVSGEKFKTALGALWHDECFACSECRNTIERGQRFFRGKMDMPVCEMCKKSRVKRCKLCGEPTAKTENVSVHQLAGNVHVRCFRCNICDASLLGGYVEKKKQLLCPAHRNDDPVKRNWADPNDKGPGQPPSKPVLQHKPTAADKEKARIEQAKAQRRAAKIQEKERRAERELQRKATEAKARQQRIEDERTMTHYSRPSEYTRSDVFEESTVLEDLDETELDATLIAELLDEEFDSSSKQQHQEEEEDSIDSLEALMKDF